jgi:dienelactone hydrolase
MPGALLVNPPVSNVSVTAAQLAAQLSAPELAVAGAPACGVNVFYLQYQTVGGASESTNASGALMVPTGASGCSGARPIVVYAHGTASTKGYNLAKFTDPTNEAWSESQLIASIFAAQGYIVVATNYAGYDTSTLSYHPYLNGAQQSADVINSLSAARTALSALAASTGVSDNGQLFLTGYSQGGYVAMATHKAMQAANMTVTAAAPMSGPYALEAMGDAVMFGNVNIGSTEFLPLLTTSYQKAYGNIYNATTDIYSPTYATGIDTLLPTTSTLTTLFTENKLPELALFDSITPVTSNATLNAALAVPSNALFALGFGNPYLLLNSVRQQYALDAFASPDGAVPSPVAGVPLASAPQYPLRVAFNKNDLRSWTPSGTAPILLCGGHDDPTVFYSVNTQTMEAYWPSLVSGGQVTALDVDPGAALASGGISTQVATIAATSFATDLGAGVTSAATFSAHVTAAVVTQFPSYFTGTTPNSPQGILVAAVAAVAAQAVGADFTAGVTSPTTVASDVGNAIVLNYHGGLVPPACSVAARAFFAKF